MPSDAWTQNPKPKQKSLESLKETFKQRLDAILNKQITVENIETFADEALDKTIKLTEDISKEYETNGVLNAGPASMREKEDFAFSALELPNLQEVLQSIIDVKERIDRIRKDIGESNINADKVLIPPQHDSPLTLNNGTGQGIEKKKLIPRLLTLLYILETDFDIKKEQVKIIEGKVTPEMVRQTPYVRVEVTDMGRLIYICDEEGNASYVFDTDKLEEAGISTETLDVSDKGAINELIVKHPGIGARVIQTKNWRMKISELLDNPIPEKSLEENPEKPTVSEFTRREKREFLSFGEFQAEIIRLYPGEENLAEWYDKERKKHKNWPTTPYRTYKGKGWEGFPKLVGKENPMKFFAFEDFKAEILKFYRGEKDVQRWYKQTRKKHLHWFGNPVREYKDRGWKGWPELVDRENRTKIEYLSLQDLEKAVQASYPGKINAQDWYKKERKNHTNWPSNPDRFYKDKGWTGWPDFVVKKKE